MLELEDQRGYVHGGQDVADIALEPDPAELPRDVGGRGMAAEPGDLPGRRGIQFVIRQRLGIDECTAVRKCPPRRQVLDLPLHVLGADPPWVVGRPNRSW